MKKSKYGLLPKVSDVETAPRGPGRPKGAGTSPDAIGVTLRISRDIYKRAQVAVIEADDGRPLSKVVEDFLADWLNERSKGARNPNH